MLELDLLLFAPEPGQPVASDVLQLGRRERGRRVPVERGVPFRAGGGALFKEREPPEVLDGPEPGPPSMEAPIHTSGHAEAPVALVRVGVGVGVGVCVDGRERAARGPPGTGAAVPLPGATALCMARRRVLAVDVFAPVVRRADRLQGI